MTNHKPVIIIGTKAENGKNELAKLIKEELQKQNKKAIIMGFGDETRLVATYDFGWGGTKSEEDRSILQEVSSYLRKISKICTSAQTERRMRMLDGRNDYFIVADARYPEEIKHIRDCGRKVFTIHIEREGFNSTLTEEQKQHESETSLSKNDFEINVVNTTMAKLKREAKLITNAILNDTVSEYIENSKNKNNKPQNNELKIEFNFENYEDNTIEKVDNDVSLIGVVEDNTSQEGEES